MSGPDLKLSKEEIATRLSHIINTYEFNAVKSLRHSVWFLGGRPGQKGFERLARAQQLQHAISQPEMSDEEAAYRVAEFYFAETEKSILRSRLVDRIEKLLADAFGIAPYSMPVTTNAHAAGRHAMEYDTHRYETIISYLDAHKDEYQQPLVVNAEEEVNNQSFINDFEKLLNMYRETRRSTSPWFFGGQPGRAGEQRLTRASNLLSGIRNGSKTVDDAKDFYENESMGSLWNSRLLDGMQRLFRTYGYDIEQPSAISIRMNVFN